MRLRWSFCPLFLAALGCGPQVGLAGDGDGDGDTAGSEGTTTTDDRPPSTTLPPSPSTTGSSPSTTGDVPVPPDTGKDDGFDDGCVGFIGCRPDAPDTPFECDTWTQDCPDGQTCAPWANDGGNHWNGTRCTPVPDGAAQVGEPCTVEGSQWSGFDDCAEGLLCFFAAETNTGTCVPMCSGEPANPTCLDPDDTCVVDFDGSITLCLPVCDPLLQDCAAGACYTAHEGGGFACGLPLEPTAAPGETCEVDWDCDPGSLCWPADELAACAGASCCSPICDLSEPPDGTCPRGETCTPLVTDGPPQYFDVGVCALPG